MADSEMLGNRLRFEVSPKHRKKFDKEMKSELIALEQKNIRYYVFEDKDSIIPKLTDEYGNGAVGLTDIKAMLQSNA